jgi:hypothetical protein
MHRLGSRHVLGGEQGAFSFKHREIFRAISWRVNTVAPKYFNITIKIPKKKNKR